MLQKMYESTMTLAGHRQAVAWLALVSFIESSVFPIPPDVMLISMVLAKRCRAWTYAAVCTIASVIGGLAGYGVGYFLFETAGQGIITFYHLQDSFLRVCAAFNQYGVVIILVAAFTPLPYKLITISAGVIQFDPLMFVVTSLVGRGLRFFLVAGLLWRFGALVRAFIERWLGLVTLGIGVAVVGGLLFLRMF
ncbi:FIG139438: lipoprotein B [invertebrate metagenome]|uniref:FIG139438: lipoprotein B n=1 Tax=invertebrate metagenome TaxID=1711999 RepID=A0A484H6X4_9ZZZZ